MTKIEAELLRLILTETERVASLRPTRDWFKDDPIEWVHRRQALDDLENGIGVRVSGGWIGTNAAARQARRRGLLGLEKAGLIKLSAVWGCATTHVILTPDGVGASKVLPAGAA